MFKVNQFVKIKKYAGDQYNEEGRINHIREDGTYWVTNMNQPFMGSVSDFFTEDELEAI